jgi:PPOX class probable F420-dependent enzyme
LANPTIPTGVADLFTGKHLAHLATLTASGRPMVSPVWIDREGDLILVNSAAGRKKNANMAVGARVALSIVDAANPFRYVGVQGEVIERRSDGDFAHIDKVSLRYMGKPYPRRPGEEREMFVIRPTRVKVQG